MSAETDRYYADGYEAGAMDLHKWMRRVGRADEKCLALAAELEECQEWRCHDRDINNDQVERIREYEEDLAKYQACRVHDVDEKAWLSKRVTELEAELEAWKAGPNIQECEYDKERIRELERENAELRHDIERCMDREFARLNPTQSETKGDAA